MGNLRESVLQAAASIQYDTATLPARQFGQEVPPEPFSKQQQNQSVLTFVLTFEQVPVMVLALQRGLGLMADAAPSPPTVLSPAQSPGRSGQQLT